MSRSNLLIAYGSQTGTAESIARRIFEEIISSSSKTPGKLKWRPTLCTLDQTLRSKNEEHLLANHDTIVIICSTTGDGDAPENADRFLRQLKRKSAKKDLMQRKRVAILGLGDTNYNMFCHAPREIHRRVKDLQGSDLMEVCLADDATGLEEVVEPWIEKLHETLSNCLAEMNGDIQAAPITPDDESSASVNEDSADVAAAMGDQELLQKSKTVAAEGQTTTTTTTTTTERNETNEVESMGQECFLRFSTEDDHSAMVDSNAQTKSQEEEEEEVYDADGEPAKQSQRYTESNPFWAPVTGVRYLTTDADKVVMHMELNINDNSNQWSVGKTTEGAEGSAENKMAFQYKPGDAIGILAENPLESVQRFLDRVTHGKDVTFDGLMCTDKMRRPAVPSHLEFMMMDSEERQNHKGTFSLRQLLRSKIDILGQVTVLQLKMLALHCRDTSDRLELQRLASNPNRFMVTVRQQNANILDVLQWFPSCEPNLVHFLQVSQPIRARFFSISNSPLAHPGSVHIAFTLLAYQTGPPHRLNKKGLCSHHFLRDIVAEKFLASSAPIHGDTNNPREDDTLKVPIFLRPAPEFSLDVDLSRPVIMIGPGTGIAPFRGFVQHRLHLREYHLRRGGGSGGNAPVSPSVTDMHERRGREWLFHGCRKEKRDFLYREELTKWQNQQQDGTFSIKLACSQETPNDMGMWYGGGIYVQDLMREYASDLIDMMFREQGKLYVCGDANSMARQVHSVMADIIYQQRYQVREIKERLADEKSNLHIPDIHSEQDALNELQRWETTGRYQRDVWTS